MMKDPDAGSRRFVQLVRMWHPLLLVPPLLVLGALLLTSDAIWVTRGPPRRGGGPGATLSSTAMFTAVGACAVYFLSPLVSMAGGGVLSRTPSDGERSVIVVLIRLGALAVLYVTAASMFRRFG